MFDDFEWYISPHFWTSLVADVNSAVSVGDAREGRLTVNTGDATDNNEALARSTNEVFLFGADRTIYGEWRIQYTEAATNAANVAVGFADAAGADLLGDNGAGDAIANSGALIFKVDGETVWRAACENNAVIRETQSVQTAGGASFQRLGILVRPIDGTDLEVTYFLDGYPLTDSNNRPIKHTLAYASATEMRLVGLYVKAGSAATQTAILDWVHASEKRA